MYCTSTIDRCIVRWYAWAHLLINALDFHAKVPVMWKIHGLAVGWRSIMAWWHVDGLISRRHRSTGTPRNEGYLGFNAPTVWSYGAGRENPRDALELWCSCLGGRISPQSWVSLTLRADHKSKAIKIRKLRGNMLFLRGLALGFFEGYSLPLDISPVGLTVRGWTLLALNPDYRVTPLSLTEADIITLSLQSKYSRLQNIWRLGTSALSH